MKTTKIYGVIVDQSFDSPWWQPEMDNGVITPCSAVQRECKAADGDDLTVRINSYGGDVFAGWTMASAICAWKKRNPRQKLTVEIEALAASAAANLLMEIPSDTEIRAYPHAMIMYHSAMTSCYDANPGELKDAAAFIDKINAHVKDQLIQRTTLPVGDILTWFQDGRTGWIDADTAETSGLISDILDTEEEASQPPVMTPEKAAQAESKAHFSFAALAANPRQSLAAVIADGEHTQKEHTTMTKKAHASVDDPEKDPNIDETQPDVTQPEDPKNTEDDKGTDHAEPEKKPEEGSEDHQVDCAPEDDDPMKKEVEALKARIDQLEKDLAKAQRISAKLTAGFGAPAGDNGDSAPRTWREAVEAVQAANPSWKRDACFAAAKAKYPELYKQIRNS